VFYKESESCGKSISMNNLHAHASTSQSTVLLKNKLIVAQLVKKFLVYYVTQKFITVSINF
jgi:hypothetical protein